MFACRGFCGDFGSDEEEPGEIWWIHSPNHEVNVSHKGHRQGEDSAAQSFQESDEKRDAIFWSVEDLAGTS